MAQHPPAHGKLRPCRTAPRQRFKTAQPRPRRHNLHRQPHRSRSHADNAVPRCSPSPKSAATGDAGPPVPSVSVGRHPGPGHLPDVLPPPAAPLPYPSQYDACALSPFTGGVPPGLLSVVFTYWRSIVAAPACRMPSRCPGSVAVKGDAIGGKSCGSIGQAAPGHRM